MPFGFCRDCTYCRSTLFMTFSEWMDVQINKTYFSDDEHIVKEEMPETAFLNEGWKCCRHAPTNHRCLKRCTEGEPLTDAMFPVLDPNDVWDRTCGCGEFKRAK